MKLPLILTVLLILVNSVSYACDKNITCLQIMRNKPKLDRIYALKVARSIEKASKRHGIPSNIYTAILAQESGYKVDSTSKITGIYDGVPTTITIDFGISQINWRNVEKHKFNIDKLLTDLDYSVNAGAIILSGFKRYKSKEKTWWTRYYSSNSIKRSEYAALVKRYL